MSYINYFLFGLAISYVFYCIYNISNLFFVPLCPTSSSSCIHPYIKRDPQFILSIFSEEKKNIKNLIWKSQPFSYKNQFEEEVFVDIPPEVRRNGSMIGYLKLEDGSTLSIEAQASLTSYSLPQASTFKLIADGEKSSEKTKSPSVPLSHWNSKLFINIIDHLHPVLPSSLPPDLFHYFRLKSPHEYLPIMVVDQLSLRLKHLMPLNSSCEKMPLVIVYKPSSIGRLRFNNHLKESFTSFSSMGFTDGDLDDLKDILVAINPYLLFLTIAVSAFHLLFDFLAFKSDIKFWKSRSSMQGLSSRTLVWSCVSSLVVLLFLYDKKSSYFITIPSLFGFFIELWKLTKIFKLERENYFGKLPFFKVKRKFDSESKTETFDAQAMKWLWWLLVPIVTLGSAYSLLFLPHKGWYSWTIETLSNGVYAFGFIFMLPQLFINYKLKSVAHLPWKVLAYKAFNTFIDDLFAFIITMPTTHRLACFRDDVVFIIYLYQRWLYPVDMKRVNEFGQSFKEKQVINNKNKENKEIIEKSENKKNK